ncbi:unnamed protein product, partial [Adineta steineri]
MKHIVARLHADKNANRLHAEYFPTKYDWFFGQDIPGVKLIPPIVGCSSGHMRVLIFSAKNTEPWADDGGIECAAHSTLRQ